MRRLIRAAAALAAVSCLSSCSVNISLGDADRKMRTAAGTPTTVSTSLDSTAGYSLSIEDIHIVSRGGIELYVDPALEDTVTVKAAANLAETIDVSVDGSRITIRGNDRLRFTDGMVEITLGTSLSALYVETGIELEAKLPDVTTFTLQVDGAIDGEIDFGALETLEMTINGAVSLELDGRCENAEITVNGAGSIDAEELICTTAAVTINGAGACDIHVTDTLDAAVNGVGSIRYSGSPATVNKSGGGIGAVRKE